MQILEQFLILKKKEVQRMVFIFDGIPNTIYFLLNFRWNIFLPNFKANCNSNLIFFVKLLGQKTNYSRIIVKDNIVI